jgi:membrane protease YdiL (CAAX protease family)
MSTGRKVAISTGKILAYFLLLGVMAAGGVEMVLPAMGLSLDKPGPVPTILTQTALNFVIMAVPAFLMAAVLDHKSPVTMGLGAGNAIVDFLTGGVVGTFIFVFALAGAFLGGWAMLNPALDGLSMQVMAVGAVAMTLGAAGEEIMMRGYILQELMGKFSTATSVIASSVIFTTLHAGALLHSSMALIGALNIFAASLLLSLAYLATRSLWLPIGVHMGWNFAQGPLLGINVSGNDFAAGWHPVMLSGPELMTGGKFGFEASLLGLAGPLLGIVMMALFRRRASA